MIETIIYGGSFNPPTLAHEAIVDACLELYPKSEVWVMPSADRVDKSIEISKDHRLEMIGRMACGFGTDRVRVCRAELEELPVPTKTWQTVEYLENNFPNRHFKYVYGADAYNSMHLWERGEQLQKHLDIILIPRIADPELSNKSNVTPIQMTVDVENISSSLARQRTARGTTIHDLVPFAVERYIQDNLLYQTT